MTNVLHRNLHDNLRTIVHGEGVYLTDKSGKSYLDASGGAAVSSLGHRHPAILQALHDQLDAVEFAHTGSFTTRSLEDLGTNLARLAPGSLNYSYISSSGSEAVETALKVSRKYYLEVGEYNRKYYISRRQSYHGSTLATLSVGKHMRQRHPFECLLRPSHHVDCYYPFRFQRVDESVEEYAIRVADQLEHKIVELGPENVIGFVAETIGGATPGVLVPSSLYLKRIREICDHYGIMLILDEVMCGMGRSGNFFACDIFDVEPDIITVAKGLGGGYIPIGATICSDKIYNAIYSGTGILQHGNTYNGHPVACAAANAVIKTIEEQDLLQNVVDRGSQLISKLYAVLGDHPNIGDIRGKGLFIGIEFVKDKFTLEPLPPELKFFKILKEAAMNQGLICYPTGGTIDGFHGDQVILAPPFIIDEGIVEEIVDRLTQSIQDAITTAQSELPNFCTSSWRKSA